mmetsp:Transcript_27967/g.39293  ORF Transcript_27967/g.39293 Transcript_27967/m.39293 type:complete len:282 (+) Transcript_27967:93-938(+)
MSGKGCMSEKTLAKLAEGLTLDGAELRPPKMHPVKWTEGRKFTVDDDPDRMLESWTVPEFVRTKDPINQRKRTTVENIELPECLNDDPKVFARIVYNVIDEEDCATLIEAVNTKGFTPALLNIGAGRQQLVPSVRDGHRVIVDSPELSTWLFHVLQPALPQTLAGAELVELNERCRFLCYTPGQEFAPHCDGRYARPHTHAHAHDFSQVTAQIYLHDVPKENGGATTFLFGAEGEVACQPRAGSVLLFSQNLMHEGSILKAGLKYTLRTEAMYRRSFETDE